MRTTQPDRVRPKKSLGQHFLHDKNIADKIVQSLVVPDGVELVLEIGPGMGVLTQFLVQRKDLTVTVIEIDRDSVAYLEKHYPDLSIISGDFLELDLHEQFPGKYSIIGSFPYNISSQIFFKVLENRDRVWQVVGMVQKEVADRIAAPHGNKTYGILSVLLQAFYTVHYLFKVPPGVFNPPPKVMSAVIRLERNNRQALPCSEELFFKVVKQGFNNRRKTLRNALKNLILPALQHLPPDAVTEFLKLTILDKRAEQLSVDEFIHLTQLIEKTSGAANSI